MHTINLKLSDKSINELINKLKVFNDTLEDLDNDIVNELCEIGQSKIKEHYANTKYKDGNNKYTIEKQVVGNKGKVFARGTQVLYNEFGTGEEGLASPHPLKGNFSGLKPYNSGRRIRLNKDEFSNATMNGIGVNEKFWTYKNDMGFIVYTQGIPAGLQVYNTYLYLDKHKGEIVEKVIGDAIRKL